MIDQRLFPVLAVLVAAAVHEIFELTVGDFVFIDPVVREMNRRRTAHLKLARRHPYHSRRNRLFWFEAQRGVKSEDFAASSGSYPGFTNFQRR